MYRLADFPQIKAVSTDNRTQLSSVRKYHGAGSVKALLNPSHEPWRQPSA
jgi:hypothetical protein